MANLKQKISTIKWLKEIGIEYCCTENMAVINSLKNIKKTEKLQTKALIDIPTTQPINNALELSSRDLANSAKTLEELRNIVVQFKGCELSKFATNTVFADGIQSAPIMLIGEAPGASEDLEGIPFCGESGKLLDKMLACIDISRKTNAYITNTIFWRPPANRPPTQAEIEICRPFVEKHIALINPKLIILVGSTAATSLLGTNLGITKIRQEYYNYSNQYLLSSIPVTAIFHPAYLLRQPMQKKTTWYDLLKIQNFILEKNISG